MPFIDFILPSTMSWNPFGFCGSKALKKVVLGILREWCRVSKDVFGFNFYLPLFYFFLEMKRFQMKTPLILFNGSSAM